VHASDFSRAFSNREHGWRAVTLLKTFLDETGIHHDAEMVAVAGYIGRPKTWRDWTKDWTVHKRRVPAGRNPIKVFHSRDCANHRGEFEGWTREDRDSYVTQLLPVIPAHELAGIVVGIHLPSFKKALDFRPELIELFGTPYAACFQWAITSIVEIVTDFGKGERMAFVHETNNSRGDAMKAFDFINKHLNPRSIPMTMGFGSKADYPPLQAADVLAYEGGKYLKSPGRKLRRAWTVLNPDNKMICRRYSKESIPKLVSLLTEYRAKLLAAGWDAKS
jgi:hypothetical protein